MFGVRRNGGDGEGLGGWREVGRDNGKVGGRHLASVFSALFCCVLVCSREVRVVVRLISAAYFA